jgi:hypothetical protein
MPLSFSFSHHAYANLQAPACVAAARIRDEYKPCEEDSEAERAWEFEHSGWARKIFPVDDWRSRI